MSRSLHRRQDRDASLNSYSRAYTKSSKVNMERVESASKTDNRPKSKFHVGDEVYTNIVDYTGSLQRRGPYLIAKVLGGGKYILCYYSGDIAEGGKEIDEKDLVAA